ncbi:LigT-like protein [Fomitiporia mediterranea MF3/22]|uniref:LigT-like protein n=1 Tax=Fomitiporia mediterranea (strain MF3/22) TaxID=694068 RepID=UPI0004407B48|nr:LigT-like protein [Fomitiporia mediterranea MF3/22]EJD05700.1 LigT-like protein [Fomitiporia mediterranea MF3/22]
MRLLLGIALWIVPPEPAATQLKQLMRIPSSLDPLPSCTLPSFEPHITLSSFPSSVPLELLRSVLGEIKQTNARPLRVEFTGFGTGDTFFRSVVIDVLVTPELQDVHDRVQRAVRMNGYEVSSPRFPHISLFYIPDEFGAERKRIRDALWETCGIQCGLDYPGRMIAFKVSEGVFSGFDTFEVWIVRCEGPVEGWEVLEKVELAG